MGIPTAPSAAVLRDCCPGEMQMGPALLPTPLSPARGLPSLSRPEAVLFRKRLAPDVFPRALRPAFCHRRSRRHPVRSLEGPVSPGRSPLPRFLWLHRFPRSRSNPLMIVPSGSLSRPKARPFPFLPDRVFPTVVAILRIQVIELSCFRREPSAVSSRWLRGQSLPHREVLKFSSFSILSDEKLEVIFPSRHIQTAPRIEFWQARHRRLFHFQSICLWRAVDNSTARRFIPKISQECAQDS